MTGLIKKIHMYLGLLNFSILLVFGVAGLLMTVLPAPEERNRPEPLVEFRPFTAPEAVDDQQLAVLVYEHVRPPLAAPVPSWAVRRDGENSLALDFYTPNGRTRAIVLEKEKRIRLEEHRADFWHYLNNLHATTIGSRAPDWRLHLWTYYTEFSIWSLLAMAATGVWLWLASRPRYRLAQWSFALGSGGFLLLYALMR